MKNIKIISMLLVLVLVFANIELNVCASEDNLKLYAQAAVLMDANSGRVLYGKNEKDVLPMASTTKIMTLIVALEHSDKEDIVEVSSYAASMPDVQLNIREGEKYKLKDLYYSLMLESHNDTAVAIAEHVGGSVEGFAALMNKKALEIGCENTYYITPNGLDASKGDKIHSTTATDLARVMSYCVVDSDKREEFLEITRTANYSFSDVDGSRSFTCTNHNAFLNMMSGALSGKTGYTSKAGYCYVGALKQDERTFVVALLACGWPNHKTYKWSDTRCLMEYGLENYEYRKFSDVEIPAEAYQCIEVNNAQGTNIGEKVYANVEIKDEVNMLNNDVVKPVGEKQIEGILMREDEKFTLTIQKTKILDAPVNRGKGIGYVTYNIDNEEWKRLYIVIAEKKDVIDLKWCIRQIIKRWLII